MYGWAPVEYREWWDESMAGSRVLWMRATVYDDTKRRSVQTALFQRELDRAHSPDALRLYYRERLFATLARGPDG